MRVVHLLTLIVFLTSCQTKHDNLKGHWHSIGSNEDSFWTLDITDSTTLVNKLDILSSSIEYPRYDEKGEEIIFFPEFEIHRDFELKGDSLILTEDFKFIRAKEENQIRDYFPNLLVSMNLARPTGNSQIELPRPSQRAHLFIGKPKENVTVDYLNEDATSFQAWDFLITYADLQNFVRYEDDKLSNTENNWLIIHADSLTSHSTIDSVRTLLEPLEILNGFIISRYNYELNQLVYEELNSR